jgi:hypothetical protein
MNDVFVPEWGLPRVDHIKKLGLYLATHGSPIYLKFSLLQILQQTRLPNYVSVYENGAEVSFKPLIEDVLLEMKMTGINVAYHHYRSKMQHPSFHFAALTQLLAMDPTSLWSQSLTTTIFSIVTT